VVVEEEEEEEEEDLAPVTGMSDGGRRGLGAAT
jgi:hypothetical protein